MQDSLDNSPLYVCDNSYGEVGNISLNTCRIAKTTVTFMCLIAVSERWEIFH